MSYNVIIARVSDVRPIEGADKIQVAFISDYRVITSVDVKPGDTLAFFEAGGQLSEEFAKTHDLVERKNPDTGERAGGFFKENRRVKSVSMKGTRSEGFACPLSLFDYTGYDTSQLKVGDQFSELNGHPICNKYITPATRQRIAGAKVRHKPKWHTKMFYEHVDTSHFRRELRNIPAGAVIHVSTKLHGTSHRVAHVLVQEEKRGWRKFFAWLTRQDLTTKTWTRLHGTRRVVLNKDYAPGFYGSHDFRFNAVGDINLRKGETVYGEIVGWVDAEKPIMGVHNMDNLKDKRLTKQFGSTITYDYGCLPGQAKFYVYRITQVNEDGDVTELSWPQVVMRANALGLETVPHIETFVFDGDYEALREKIFKLVDGDPEKPQAVPSVLDSGHIEEGVVVRCETSWGTSWLKHKSFIFGVLEGYQKEADDFVDTEEAQEVENV